MSSEKEKPYLDAPSAPPRRRKGRRRTMLLLVAVGVVLIVGSWLLIGGRGDWEFLTEENTTGPRMFTLADQGEGIDAIKIRYPSGKEHELSLRDGRWQIRSGGTWLPISSERQRLLMESAEGEPELLRPMLGAYQGNNPANHEHAFGVTSGSGLRVQFFADGDMVRDWMVSLKSPRDEASNYIRSPNSLSVYLVDANLRDNFAGERLLDWRRRWVFEDVDVGQIAAVEITELESGRPVYFLEKGDSGWSIRLEDGARPALAHAVDHTLQELSRMRILDYPPEGSGPFYASQAIRVSLKVRGEETSRSVAIGLEEASKYGLLPARLQDTDEIVMIGRPFCLLRAADSYFLPETAVTESEPTASDAASTESVELDQGEPVDSPQPVLSDPMAGASA
ncbi:DUF4340 domain-containing protein [bacterium]|nr:DUF4340 domain-containing protein [bacterium]